METTDFFDGLFDLISGWIDIFARGISGVIGTSEIFEVTGDEVDRTVAIEDLNVPVGSEAKGSLQHSCWGGVVCSVVSQLFHALMLEHISVNGVEDVVDFGSSKGQFLCGFKREV